MYCIGFWLDKMFVLKVYDEDDAFVTSSSFDNYADFYGFYLYLCVEFEVDEMRIKYYGTNTPTLPEFKPSSRIL